MKKNGQLAFVGIFITAVLAIILLANLLIPTVKGSTDLQTYSDSYARTNNSLNQTKTLTYVTGVSITSITNGSLTLTSNNYTLASGVVTFLQNQVPVSTYTIAYSYQPTNYLTNATERIVMGLVVLAGLIGVIYWLFTAFGLI
jgi:hypothetical protein